MPSSRSRADARRRVLTWCRFLPLLRHFNPRGRGAHSPLKLRFVSWGRLFRISGCFISVLLGGAFPELGKKAADARGVHAEIGPPDPRAGAQVDHGGAHRRIDADDDLVLEAIDERSVNRLDALFIGLCSDDLHAVVLDIGRAWWRERG